MLTALALGYGFDSDGASPADFGLDRERLAGQLSLRPVGSYGILLHATAQATKEWPEQSWIELGRMLNDDALLIPWGTKDEQARSLRIATAIPNARVPDRAPLDEVARLIAGAQFVVGVDTGLLHLAAALGVPLVGIFVGSKPGLTGPRGRGPIAIVGGKGAAPSPQDVAAGLAGIAR
jgi:heptosyltransferase-1